MDVLEPRQKDFLLRRHLQGEIWKVRLRPRDRHARGTSGSSPRSRNDTGVADGSTVDAEGCVWNAQLISGDLVRYAPDGSVERRIGMR